MTVTINGTTGVAGVDGTAATPAIQGNDTNTGIFFPAADTIAFAEGGAEVARFDSSGNLGIGTSSPATKIDARLSGTSSGTVINVGNTGTGIFGGVGVSDGGAYPIELWGSALSFKTGSSTYASATEKMRIDSSGNLLLNATGTIAAGCISLLFNGTSRNGIGLKTTLATNGTDFIVFENSAGSTAGRITQNGTTSVAYNTSSDYRLKENIAPMTGALATVQALKPVTYTWKADGSAGQGFIAHELQEIVPDCVTGEKDAVQTTDELDADGNVIGTKEVPKYQGIDTSFLVATLTAAIQEQQAIITDLKSRIEALEQA
jgi:hypothetical protein